MDEDGLFLRAGSKRWYVDLKDPRAPEGRRRISTGTDDRAEARRIAADRQREIDDEIAARAQGITFYEALTDYLQRKEITESTRRTHAEVGSVIIRTVGDFPLSSWGLTEVKDFVAKRRREAKRGGGCVSDETIRRNLAVLSAVYRWTLDQELDPQVTRNPLLDYDRGKLRKAETKDRQLMPNQLEQALNILAESKADPQYPRILITLVGTGLRSSELVNLRWSEVNFVNRELVIGTQLGKRTKTARSRVVPLVDRVCQALLEQREWSEGQKNFDKNGYVFKFRSKRRDHTALQPLRRLIKRKTGWSHYRNHDLRHTFTSWALQSDISELAIKKFLGHSTLQTTARYAHLASQSQKREMRKLVTSQFGTVLGTGHRTGSKLLKKKVHKPLVYGALDGDDPPDPDEKSTAFVMRGSRVRVT